MSRIGKRPIMVPAKVSVEIAGQEVKVKGPKGELQRILPPTVEIVWEEATLVVNRRNDSRPARQQHGLCRTLVANMIEGVSTGFQRRLEIQGIGYRAAIKGTTLLLSVGYSIKELPFEPPAGIQFAVENSTNIIITGINKEIVGDTAAKIRAVRPPEVYKGKGIRYAGEIVRRKAGKAGKKK